jgi:molybdopterin synthase catalytic subunit
MGRALILTARLDPADAMLASFSASNKAAGAIVSFTGQMRTTASDGTPLTALHLEAYRGMTLASIEAILAEASARFAIIDALAVHRIGHILPGEAIVFVATAAAHRRAAFDAADWLMDQLKSNILIWKREERSDGSAEWIEPTVADAAALSRWEQA